MTTMASKQVVSNATRGNLYYMNPEDLITKVDKDHPLYDERVTYAVNERQVLFIMEHGCSLPIICRREGDKAIVMDGRQRVQAAREANKRIRDKIAKGEASEDDLVALPVVFKRADDDTAVDTMIASNSFAKTDSPLVQARKIQAYLGRGRTEEQAVATFNCSPTTLQNRLLLLAASPEVQAALEKNAISVGDAIEIGKLAKEAQAAALAAALTSNGTGKVTDNGTVEVDETKVKKTRPKKGSKKPGKGQILKVLEDAPISSEVQAALGWVLGLIDGEAASKEIKGFPKPSRKSKKGK